MENEKDMNVKIQSSGKNGATNTKGTSRNLAEYLEHEDKDRREKGLPVFPFVKADGTPVPKEEVIDKIDRNNARLSKTDYKFYHLVCALSKSENLVMGNSDEEVFQNALILIRAISDAYAENFHKEGVEDGDDLEIFWKPHFTRGDNDELQFHLHAIVSRRAKRNGPKLSPLTAHRNTQSGPVTGGFDRKAFAERCEKLFDQLMHYDRKVAETFEYLNTFAHGTAEEKAEQAVRMARENEASLRAEMEAAFGKRRKRKKERNEVEELAALLEKKDFKLPVPQQNIADAVDLASLGNDLTRVLSASSDKQSMLLNLACMGLICKPILSENGGVDDLMLTYKGHQLKVSDLVVQSQFKDMLNRWGELTGEEPAFKISQRQEAERKLKLTQEYENQRSRSRGIRMHF
ncbi:MAG: DUF5712 family protein [Bacteroidaceae bacterium]|nr:DUF5712 family protein [Bacteroidaceae bacterium]